MWMLICRACLAGAMALTGAAAAAQTTTAGQCRQQFANDHVAQLNCARKAFATSAAQAQPAQQTPPLQSPLSHMQVIFGFFDRRFPGFNGGLEHLGVDLSAAAGAAVAAICDGTVVANNTSQADMISAVLMVEHDCPQPLGRVFAYYGHVQSELLPGVAVAAGSSIGNVREWPGNSHLHLGLSTRLQDETWGVVARGTTLPELEAQGWLNPLDFLAATQPRQAANGVARPTVARRPVSRAGKPAALIGGTPKRKR